MEHTLMLISKIIGFLFTFGFFLCIFSDIFSFICKHIRLSLLTLLISIISILEFKWLDLMKETNCYIFCTSVCITLMMQGKFWIMYNFSSTTTQNYIFSNNPNCNEKEPNWFEDIVNNSNFISSDCANLPVIIDENNSEITDIVGHKVCDIKESCCTHVKGSDGHNYYRGNGKI